MKPAVFATLMTAASVVAIAAAVLLVRLIPPNLIGNALIGTGGLALLVALWGIFYQIGESRK